jgi:hypothetical protein
MNARDQRLCVELTEDELMDICAALTVHARKFEDVGRRRVTATTKRVCAERAAKLRALALTLAGAMNGVRRL